mmetsp:Transcript_24323/g.69872  ORF Transcript_24323/g.69872 Transcript_24323/m.69872 type:complete len:274 (+) Transcript_24323:195-1016(+)
MSHRRGLVLASGAARPLVSTAGQQKSHSGATSSMRVSTSDETASAGLEHSVARESSHLSAEESSHASEASIPCGRRAASASPTLCKPTAPASPTEEEEMADTVAWKSAHASASTFGKSIGERGASAQQRYTWQTRSAWSDWSGPKPPRERTSKRARSVQRWRWCTGEATRGLTPKYDCRKPVTLMEATARGKPASATSSQALSVTGGHLPDERSATRCDRPITPAPRKSVVGSSPWKPSRVHSGDRQALAASPPAPLPGPTPPPKLLPAAPKE